MMNKYLFIIVFSLFFSSALNAETTRIMLLGDSITFDYRFLDNTNPRPLSQRSGYRNYLWYKLKAAKYDVDFVGRQHAGSAIRPVFDIDHEGYSGISSQGIADGIAPPIQLLAPHIVVLHIGTNDYSTSITGVENILKKIDALEKSYHFPITIIVARIINKTNYSSIVSTFNRNLQRMLDRRIAKGDDLVVVDMEHDAGLHYDSRDFSDLLHPNNSGYRKMAEVWFKAIDKVMKRKNNNAFLIPTVYSLLLN